jgi:hypothetical protein
MLFGELFCCVAGSGGPKGAFALMGLHLLVQYRRDKGDMEICLHLHAPLPKPLDSTDADLPTPFPTYGDAKNGVQPRPASRNNVLTMPSQFPPAPAAPAATAALSAEAAELCDPCLEPLECLKLDPLLELPWDRRRRIRMDEW